MPKIEMYTTSICPFCVRAKNLLDSKGVKYTEYDVMRDPQKKIEMKDRNPGCRTVPQIFIDDKPYGGCDDLYALNEEGKLDVILAGEQPA